MFAFVCTLPKKYVGIFMIILSATIMIGVTMSFCSGVFLYENDTFSFSPAFIPNSKSPWLQAIYIACISPWAFIGFKNISHSTEEFKFQTKKSYSILAAALSDYIASTDSSFHAVFERADKLMYNRKKELKKMASAE